MNRKIILKYGTISGLAIVASWFVTYFIWGPDLDFSGAEIVGFAVMILALTAVFVGVKNERDDSSNTEFSFKEGFITGLGIVVIATIIYVVGWMIFLPNFAPDFTEKYTASQVELIQQSEASDSEKKARIEEVTSSMEDYANKAHVRIVYTALEIFPVGLFVALISAGILRRKP